jgi:hypothetical protein
MAEGPLPERGWASIIFTLSLSSKTNNLSHTRKHIKKVNFTVEIDQVNPKRNFLLKFRV